MNNILSSEIITKIGSFMNGNDLLKFKLTSKYDENNVWNKMENNGKVYIFGFYNTGELFDIFK